ncbi:hypothetical protein [Pseudomonas sp. IAC-BECa141]|uniref:hypothetical protein n=1 Tax=Pseudomonas sp. IAC-BECa141 TaxID=2793103 RepID=UPI001D064895|nr:hypothetical protein [Pseudomonas sp. IAC-BECa141]UDI90444.1 hypothetical protein I5961_14740 [Pseudomonas sp. IAC-BECa141]
MIHPLFLLTCQQLRAGHFLMFEVVGNVAQPLRWPTAEERLDEYFREKSVSAKAIKKSPEGSFFYVLQAGFMGLCSDDPESIASGLAKSRGLQQQACTPSSSAP